MYLADSAATMLAGVEDDEEELQALVDQLRALPTEVEWVEFKEAKTSFDLENLGRYFSALANEANLKLQSEGWLILGVHDTKKDAAGKRVVVGTSLKQGTAAQNELKKLIADHTTYRATFRDIHELTMEGKRVLMFEIPPAPPGVPISWKGHSFRHKSCSTTPGCSASWFTMPSRTRTID